MRKHFLVRELRKPWDQWRALRGLNAAGKSITDFWRLGKPQGKKFWGKCTWKSCINGFGRLRWQLELETSQGCCPWVKHLSAPRKFFPATSKQEKKRKIISDMQTLKGFWTPDHFLRSLCAYNDCKQTQNGWISALVASCHRWKKGCSASLVSYAK